MDSLPLRKLLTSTTYNNNVAVVGCCDLCGTEAKLKERVLEMNLASRLTYPKAEAPKRFCLLCGTILGRINELSKVLLCFEEELYALMSGLKTGLLITQTNKEQIVRQSEGVAPSASVSNQYGDVTNRASFVAKSEMEGFSKMPDIKVEPDHADNDAEEGKLEVLKEDTKDEIEKFALAEHGNPTMDYNELQNEGNLDDSIEKVNLRGNTKQRTSKSQTNKKRPTILECCFCQKLFQGYETLNQHFELHKDQVHPGKCEICGEISASFKHLQRHHIRKHGTQKQKDALKSKKGSRGKRPKVNLDNIKKFQSAFCKKPHQSQTMLFQHLQTHSVTTNPATLVCELCLKQFQYFWPWKTHIDTHLDKVNPGKCGICGRVLVSLHSLRRHHATKHGTREQKNATASQNAKRLNKLHRVSWKCEVCEKHFVSRTTLKHHEIRMHGNEEESSVRKNGCKRENTTIRNPFINATTGGELSE